MNRGSVFSIGLTSFFLANAQAAEVDFYRSPAADGAAQQKSRVEAHKLPMETDRTELESLMRLASHPEFLNFTQAVDPHRVLGAPQRVTSQATPDEKVSMTIAKVLPIEPVSPKYQRKKNTVVDHYETIQLTVPVFKTKLDRVEVDSAASDRQ